MLGSRKNHEVYTTALGRDVLEAIRWHVDQGYAGPQFLFSQDGTFPKHLDSYKRPLRTVQKALGLPLLSHHQIGRHSMASQAATGGSGDQSHPSSTRAPLRPEHRGVRAPGQQCSTAPRQGARTGFAATSWSIFGQREPKLKNAKRVTTRNHWSGRLDSNQRPHAPKAS